MKRFLILSGLFLMGVGIQLSAKELRMVVFKVMQMECPNCEKKVKKNITFENGLKGLETDLKKRTVTITYDAEKISVKQLKEGFAKFEYDAKVISDKKLENDSEN